MRFLRLIVVAWLVTGLLAGAGALIGGIWLSPGRFIGATVAGTLGVLLTVRLLTARGWIVFERRRGASIGGLVGLALAAPFAQSQFGLATPVAALGLVGVAMIFAAGGSKAVR